MNPLPLTLLVAATTALPGTKLPSPMEKPEAACERLMPPVILVADGTPGWQTQQVDKILDVLDAALVSSRELLVTRFDAEPMPQRGFAVRGRHQDLVVAQPRTSMRETMEIGLALLKETPSPHVMVVIAHEQFYPSSVPMSRLLELARRSDTRVHTIHLASNHDQSMEHPRFVQRIRNGAVWAVERLAFRERAFSSRDTARLMKSISDATGGTACVAEDERTGIACADMIVSVMAR